MTAPQNERVFVCGHVYPGGDVVGEVLRGADGDLQAFCADRNAPHAGERPHILGWGCLCEKDPTLLDIGPLQPGHTAYRAAAGQPWTITALPSWDLLDVVEHNRRHPTTFHIPPAFVREGLRVGDFAKLVFESDAGGERMWVRVDKVRDGGYVGTLDNEPTVIKDLLIGDVIAFSACNVCDAEAPEPISLGEATGQGAAAR